MLDCKVFHSDDGRLVIRAPEAEGDREVLIPLDADAAMLLADELTRKAEPLMMGGAR